MSFPRDRYTPHGYLDNRRHAWRLARSGVVRTTGGIGFAWHVPNYPGVYGRRWVYAASLEIEGIDLAELHAEHHTKELFRFRAGEATVEVFLGDEAIVALVDLGRRGAVTARATYRRQLGVSGDWDFGLTARHDVDEGASHLGVYAEGTAFVLLGDVPVAGAGWTKPDEGWPERGSTVEKEAWHHYALPDGRLTVVLARGESSAAALERARRTVADAPTTRRAHLDADERFWSGAPRLEGDWPEHWRRGFVYDLETLRTIVRPPMGVYCSRWDGMQIQVPRVVLAETALDMLALTYADPDTAKEVILGTFRDAIAPNVPCTREDGSVNMVAIDGSACGTAPPWCWPFWCVGLLYRRTADRAWLAELLPHLEAFLDWWLANRLRADGTPFYLCSWESGQDSSPRFAEDQRGGGGIERVWPVDLTASLAQGARLLGVWRGELGQDAGKWPDVAEDFARRTRAMWHDGWFHEHEDGRPTHHRDPMQLAPFLCRVATPEQIAAVRPKLDPPPRHEPYTALEWPPVALTALEGALQAGAGALAGEWAAEVCDRVWRRTDARTQEPGMPLPGVAHEHWAPEGEWHTEGYGWGAATALLFLRYVAGVVDDPESDDLTIEPHFPPELMREGARYALTNLPWRGGRIDLRYEVEGGAVKVARNSGAAS